MLDFRRVLNAFSAPKQTQERPLFIRQSDWILQGDSIVKKWGINGLLHTGEEFTVLADVSFSRSAFGHILPHIFIFLQPNTFGEPHGFIVMQIARLGHLLDYPFAMAQIDLADDGSVLVTPVQRESAASAFEVFSSGEPFRILMLLKDEKLLELDFPNDANRLSDVVERMAI